LGDNAAMIASSVRCGCLGLLAVLSSVAHACGSDAVALFGCDAANSRKFIELCAPSPLDAKSGYLLYRFGSLDKDGIEREASTLDNGVGGQLGTGFPPDTNGEVGLNHYIIAVNAAFGIYDKATGTQVAAFTENSLFSGGPTGTLCDTNSFGDPVVVYDQLANRWILTNFAFVSQVLDMEAVPGSSRIRWRAVTSPSSTMPAIS
jgi:hypothetical protein